MELMDRYYTLRKDVRGCVNTKFFVSNRGKEVVKMFNDINKNIKLKEIRYQSREDGSPGECAVEWKDDPQTV